LLISRNTRGILHILAPASPSYKHLLYRFQLKACPPLVWRVHPPLEGLSAVFLAGLPAVSMAGWFR